MQPLPNQPRDFFSASRWQIVRYVNTPLGFCTLALLIVEAFLLSSGAIFQLQEAMRVQLIYVGVALFVLVFGTVVWLVVRHPTNLVFGERSHLQVEAMRVYGSNLKQMPGETLETLPAVPQPEPPVGQPQLPAPKEES